MGSVSSLSFPTCTISSWGLDRVWECVFTPILWRKTPGGIVAVGISMDIGIGPRGGSLEK